MGKKVQIFALVLVLFLCGQAWGGADTLRPRMDISSYWNHFGCDEGEGYDCVDDPPGFPDGDLTYCYASSNLGKETFQIGSTFASNIDSVVLFITCRRIGDREVGFRPGWQYYIEGFWTFIDEDTILATSEWQTYSTNLDHWDQDWTYQKVNSRRYGVSTTGHVGDDLPEQQITQIFVVVYYRGMKSLRHIK